MAAKNREKRKLLATKNTSENFMCTTSHTAWSWKPEFRRQGNERKDTQDTQTHIQKSQDWVGSAHLDGSTPIMQATRNLSVYYVKHKGEIIYHQLEVSVILEEKLQLIDFTHTGQSL